ncbi:MAG: hypothetical protein AB7O62_03985 [Pirellulales bacterium]
MKAAAKSGLELPLVTIVQGQFVLGRGLFATGLIALGAAGCLFLLRARGALAGTTLLARWNWTLAAILSVAGSEAYFAWACDPADTRLSHWRFLAVTATFCPCMAVLGAKRPQDRAWQWIVASLWLIVAWPALEGLVYRPDLPLQLHWARQAFLLVLLAIEGINVLGTRQSLSGLAWIAGQILLLGEHLPLIRNWFAPLVAGLGGGASGGTPTWQEWRPTLAVAMLLASVILQGLIRPRPVVPGDRWQTAWLDFRDQFGTIWSLRIAERFNAAATLCDWNLRLGWRGPTAADSAQSASLDDNLAARQSLLQLLRRFVSPAWLAARGIE